LNTIYIKAKEVSAYIRKRLKADFPNIKCRVVTGSSINIYVQHEDFETAKKLSSEIRSKYDYLAGEGFDGMIDMRYSHYQLPDGSFVYGGTDGTQGSMGIVPARHNDAPLGATKVRLLNDFVFAQADYNTCRKAA
jgi:hypothetical protein